MYKKLYTSALVIILSATLGLPLVAAHAASSTILINEVQTGTAQSASDEFVELYNTSTANIDLAGWTVDYKPATSATWTTRATLSGAIAPGGYYLMAPHVYIATANADWSAGLSNTAGHVRLVDKSGTVIDTLGYGTTANAPEGSPAAAPAPGQSLERIIAADSTIDDTDNNATDFRIQTQPSPGQSSNGDNPDPVAAPVPAPTPGGTTTPVTAPTTTTQTGYDGLQITELFIDPAAPKTDAKDEYIELWNGSNHVINLGGLVLRCGKSFGDHYTLPAQTIAPGQYLAFYAAQTHLGLTNSGGTAELTDASGGVIDATAPYAQAMTGDTWALFGEDWAWTTTVTPAAANIETAPTPAAIKATAAKASNSKATASKTAKATAVKKTTASKVAKATKVAAAKTVDAAEVATNSTGRWLLMGLAGLTIAYGIYEYRHRLYNYYRLARSHVRLRG